MRRVVLKYPLPKDVNEIRTGPNPAVRLVAEQAGELCVWIEVDQVAPDLDDPAFRSVVTGFVVIGTGWLDSVDHSFSAHAGSVQMSNGLVWHVYTVDHEALRASYVRRQAEASRVLRRTAFGHELRAKVRSRDRGRCRFCASDLDPIVLPGQLPESPHRPAYVVLDLGAELAVDNVVQACGRCETLKGVTPLPLTELVLLDPPTDAIGGAA